MLPLLLVPAAFATCTTLIDDDLTDGASDGDAWGGSWGSDGWTPSGGTTVYSLPYGVDSGRFEITLAGLEEAGLSQNDVAEMFTGPEGSFSDGEVYSFLQLKMAGDVYDGYAGRIKMQIGGEYADEAEMGMWSDERDWSPADTHVITVTWGDGMAVMEHDGDVVAEVDYSAHDSGFVPFESLRIPNDGRYAYDPASESLRYLHVTLCGEPEVVPGAPTVQAFDVQPREVAQPAALSFVWDVAGAVDTLQVCGQARSTGEILCGAISGASGSTAVASDVLYVDTWDIWLEAAGDGGTVRSSLLPVAVHEAGWVPDTSGGDSGGGDSTVDPAPEDGGQDGGQDTDLADPAEDPGKARGVPGATATMEDGGCGCAQAGGGHAGWAVAALVLGWRSRRRMARAT